MLCDTLNIQARHCCQLLLASVWFYPVWGGFPVRMSTAVDRKGWRAVRSTDEPILHFLVGVSMVGRGWKKKKRTDPVGTGWEKGKSFFLGRKVLWSQWHFSNIKGFPRKLQTTASQCSRSAQDVRIQGAEFHLCMLGISCQVVLGICYLSEGRLDKGSVRVN